MICPNCGFENEDYAEFCMNCGAALTDTGASADAQDYYDEGGYAEIPPEKKPVDVLGIVGIALGAVALFVGCCCSFIPLINFVTPYVAPILAIAGIVVAAIGLVKTKKAGDNMVLSIVGLCLSAVMLIVTVALALLNLVSSGMSIAAMTIGFIEEYM